MDKKNLPQKRTWLTQPLVVTMMRYDYSLLQIKVLVSIIEKFQQHISNAIKFRNEPEHEHEQLNLFSSEEFSNEKNKDSIFLNLPIKDFGIPPKHYYLLREALTLLSTIPVETSVKDNFGKKWIKISSLCKAYIPEEKYSRNIIIEMDKQVVYRILDVTQGFHKYLKETIFTSKKKYTPRIYMLISPWLKEGAWKIKTEEFRKMLRLEKKYTRFSELEKRILEPTKLELEDKYNKGETNCYFEYEKIYKDSASSGEPYIIKFIIHSKKPLSFSIDNNRTNIEIQEIDMKNFPNDFESKWKNFLSYIQNELSDINFKTWFIPIVPVSYNNNDNVLVISVPSKFFYEYLEEFYLELLKDALNISFGENIVLNYNIPV